MSGTAPAPSFLSVTLGGNATTNLQAVPLQQLNSTVAGSVANNIGRNFILNPRFDIQQRGAGPWTAGNVYTADCWVQAISGGDTITTNILPVSASTAATIDESFYWLASCQVTGTSTTSSLTAFAQRIENTRRLSGKTLTLSFWGWGTVANKIGVGYQQVFGSGGSPSATVLGNIGITPAISTTTPTRYVFTFSMPSVAGKTFGTTSADFTEIDFWLSCSSANTGYYPASGNLGAQTGTFYLWGVQLELGSIATPLEMLNQQFELGMCQRYYQAAPTTIAGYSVAGPFQPSSVPLMVNMRVAPVISFASQSYTNCSGLSYTTSQNEYWQPAITVTATGNFSLSFYWAASAEF